ncbi:Sec1_family protein [Hexamita inflata]|uniref:Sec1 family protein n=1 Tax=Hexamita inflata TaxID=28002 RepID=A0AA86U0N5_9EUKA|nr:Sec1 family protein [Hexamita inflata]
MSTNLSNHPIYKFFPQTRDVIGDSMRQNLMKSSLKQISEFLIKGNAYGVLIMDDITLPMISSLFSVSELTQLRFVLKEKLHFNREPQQKMFAIYAFVPTTQNVNRIAMDFGFVDGKTKVQTVAEIKQIRQDEKCCVPTNRFYNPYNYRGLFLLPTKDFNEQILIDTGLINLTGKTKYNSMNMSFIVRESHFIDLQEPDSFKNLFFSKTVETKPYVESVSSKIAQIMQNLGVGNLNIKFQKLSSNNITSQIAEAVQKKVKKLEGSSPRQQTLLILDRGFDPLSLISYNLLFGPLVTDLMDVNTHFSTIEENGSKLNVNISESNMAYSCTKQLYFLAAKEQINKSAQDFKNVANAKSDVRITDGNNQVTIPQLDESQQTSFKVIVDKQSQKLEEILTLYTQLNKWINDKTIKLIFDAEKAIFGTMTNFAGMGLNDLMKQQVMDNKYLLQGILEYSKKQSANQIVGLRLIMLIILTFTLIGEAGNEKTVNELLDCVQKEQLKADKKYAYAARNYQQFLKKHCNINRNLQFILNLFSKRFDVESELKGQIMPSVLDILCRCMNNGDSVIFDALFQGNDVQKTLKVGQVQVQTEAKELELAKARFYAESETSKVETEKQMKEDRETFDRREKVFVYIAGGATYNEIVSAHNNSLEPGKLGFFNQGTQFKEREFILISDFWAQPGKFIDMMTE